LHRDTGCEPIQKVSEIIGIIERQAYLDHAVDFCGYVRGRVKHGPAFFIGTDVVAGNHAQTWHRIGIV